jgi:hypothetical protein
MGGRIQVVVCAMTLIGAASPAPAQDWFKPRLSDMTTCPGGFANVDARELAACVKQLAKDTGVAPGSQDPPPILSPGKRTSETREEAAAAEHKRLLQYYAAYVAAKRQAKRLNATSDVPTIMAAGTSIHESLREHELEETSPLVGELRAGSALADTGTFSGLKPESTDNSTTTPLAHIVWTTTHAGAMDKESGSDITFSGRLGLEPAMTALKLSSGTLDAKYQQALVVGAGIDFSGFSGPTETSFVVRTGFVRLGELAQIVEKDGVNELALPAGGDGKVAPYFEAGGRFNLFDRKMLLVHLSHAELSPRLSTEVLYRRDARFDNLGVDVTRGDFLVWRLMVDGLQIVDKRTEPAGNKVFQASFGFEYRRGKNVPYGFAFLIRGDLDLLKALSSGHVEQ